MEDDCDIIIIGAGIAGTACALRCARAGLSVLLLERAEIPGSKNLSGGLVCDEEDARNAINAGVVALSTTNTGVWTLAKKLL